MVKIILFVHWAVLGFVLTAWFWPWQTALWIHAIFVPLMIVHWRTNRNRCFLSQLEERFKATDTTLTVDAEESQFIKLVWQKLFGELPSDLALERVIYGLPILVWIITIVRLTMGH